MDKQYRTEFPRLGPDRMEFGVSKLLTRHVAAPHQLFSFAEEAMGVHVDGLDAFAVHTYRQALPASLLCAGRVERRATAKSNAGRCGRAFKGTTRLARATPERQKPKRSRPRPRPPRPPPGASCGDRKSVV